MAYRKSLTDIMKTLKEKENKLENIKQEIEMLFSQNANTNNLKKVKELFNAYQQLCMDENTYFKEYFNSLAIEIKLVSYELSTNKKIKELDCTRAITNYKNFFEHLYKNLNENDNLDSEEKHKYYSEKKESVKKDIIQVCNYYCELLLKKIEKEKRQENRNNLFNKMQTSIDIIQEYEENLDNKNKQKLHFFLAEKNVLYGETEKALIEYNKAIEINPKDFKTSNRKAIYLYKLEKYKEIENIYKPFLRHGKPEHKLVIYCNLAKTFIALNDLKKAKYYINKAKQIKNGDKSKFKNQIDICEALYYFNKEKYSKSSEYYAKLQNQPYYKRKYGVSLVRENKSSNKGNDLIRESIELELSDNVTKNFPKSFYVYRELDKNTIFTVLNEYLPFSNPKDFNDPLDTKFIIDNTEYKEVKEILKKFKIRCFSGGENTEDKNNEPLNTLMWSHYAEEHKGIAIEYDFTDFKQQKNGFFFTKVNYSNVIVPNMEIIEQKDYIKSFFTKDELWKYENEYRLITFEDNLEDKYKCNIDKIGIKIKSITFGLKADDKNNLRELIRSKIPNCEFYKIEIKDKKIQPFELVRNKYEIK